MKDSAPRCSDAIALCITTQAMNRCLRFVATPLIRFFYRSRPFELVTASINNYLTNRIIKC